MKQIRTINITDPKQHGGKECIPDMKEAEKDCDEADCRVDVAGSKIQIYICIFGIFGGVVLGILIGLGINKRREKQKETVNVNMVYGLAEYYEDTEISHRNNEYYER